MPTTTNYGWTTPADTDLVKDGASAIRTLGTAIDTSTKNLNPSTTLGDIEYRSSTSNTNTRLGIGTTGQVLTVSGGVPAWATPSGAATLLSTTSLSGTSTTVSSISGSYKNLLIIVNAATWATDSGLLLQANGSSTLSYTAARDAWVAQDVQRADGRLCNVQTANATASLLIYNYANTSYKKIGDYSVGSGTFGAFATGAYFYDSTSAISSITVANRGGLTYTDGQILIYGVN
jgi:hypothetical protein